MTQKPMFDAKCTSCGKECSVPFKPTAGKPVYCRECFSKHKDNAQDTPRKSPSVLVGKEGWARRRDNRYARKNEEDVGAFHRFMYTP
jgi:CxxC-x17-CxxC domain-containing protein